MNMITIILNNFISHLSYVGGYIWEYRRVLPCGNLTFNAVYNYTLEAFKSSATACSLFITC